MYTQQQAVICRFTCAVQLFIDELDPSNATAQPAASEWDTPVDSSAPASSPAPAGAPPSTGSVPPVGRGGSPSAAPIPVRQQRAVDAARAGGGGGAGVSGLRYEENTVDESDFASLLREGRSIWQNLRLVCNPLIKQDEVDTMLQHWDMWGPLVRCPLAIAVSLDAAAIAAAAMLCLLALQIALAAHAAPPCADAFTSCTHALATQDCAALGPCCAT